MTNAATNDTPSKLGNTLISAVILVALALANCWIIQHPFPIYKTLTGGRRIWASIPYFNRLIESDPNNSKNYYERGKAYTYFGYFQSALSDFDQTLKLDPSNIQVVEDREHVLYSIKDYKRALADCNWLISHRGACATDYANRARIFYQLGQVDRSLSDARRAICLNPSLPDGHLVLAYACLASGNLSEAMSECLFAQNLLPEPSKFITKLCAAQILIAQKQYNQSIALCDYVLAKKPYGWSVFWLKALALYDLGRYAEAVDYATQSICQNPMQYAPYLIRSESYRKLHKDIEAARGRRTARQLDPSARDMTNMCYRTFPY